MIQFATYSRSEPTIDTVREVIDVMKRHADSISSEMHDEQHSDTVLAALRSDLQSIGFQVEASKALADKIKVPVLFGLNGVAEKAFDADAFHTSSGVVLEVEAGRAVTNYQFLKDLFQACMMQDAKHLVIAVRNVYRASKDFEKVINFFETLYASARLQLPLKSVTIIGY